MDIGLLPKVPPERIRFVGNSSLTGAVNAALSLQTFQRMAEIAAATTYFDLMGAANYVEEFRQAMFLPHTNIEEFSGD